MITASDWLLSRTVDPLNGKYADIKKTIIKQKLFTFLSAVEEKTKTRVYITAGWESGGHNPGSKHYDGEAVDFVLLREPFWAEVVGDELNKIYNIINQEASRNSLWLLNEYKKKTKATTGGHLHAEYREKG